MPRKKSNHNKKKYNYSNSNVKKNTSEVETIKTLFNNTNKIICGNNPDLKKTLSNYEKCFKKSQQIGADEFSDPSLKDKYLEIISKQIINNVIQIGNKDCKTKETDKYFQVLDLYLKYYKYSSYINNYDKSLETQIVNTINMLLESANKGIKTFNLFNFPERRAMKLKCDTISKTKDILNKLEISDTNKAKLISNINDFDNFNLISQHRKSITQPKSGKLDNDGNKVKNINSKSIQKEKFSTKVNNLRIRVKKLIQEKDFAKAIEEAEVVLYEALNQGTTEEINNCMKIFSRVYCYQGLHYTYLLRNCNDMQYDMQYTERLAKIIKSFDKAYELHNFIIYKITKLASLQNITLDAINANNNKMALKLYKSLYSTKTRN